MATISEQLLGQALESSSSAPNLGAALTQGAQLAQTVQNMQAQRQQMEEQKQSAQLAKVNRIMDAIEAGSNFKDKSAQSRFFKNYVPNMVKALKMEEFFNDDLMGYVQESDEVRNKLIGLRLDIQDKINKGDLRGAAIFEYAKSKLSPEELPLLDTDSLLEQQKFATSEVGKTERAQAVQAGQAARQQTGFEAAPGLEAGRDIGKAFATWKTGGGAAMRQKAEGTLQKAIEQLKNNEVEFGTAWKQVPWAGNPENVTFTKDQKKEKALLDMVRGGISIKEKTGDPNPTQTQINQVMSRIIDPRLTNEQNIEKLQTELDSWKSDTQNKLAEFSRYGFNDDTLKGESKQAPSAPVEWKQKLMAVKDKLLRMDEQTQNKFLETISKQLGISIEELKKELRK